MKTESQTNGSDPRQVSDIMGKVFLHTKPRKNKKEMALFHRLNGDVRTPQHNADTGARLLRRTFLQFSQDVAKHATGNSEGLL